MNHDSGDFENFIAYENKDDEGSSSSTVSYTIANGETFAINDFFNDDNGTSSSTNDCDYERYNSTEESTSNNNFNSESTCERNCNNEFYCNCGFNENSLNDDNCNCTSELSVEEQIENAYNEGAKYAAKLAYKKGLRDGYRKCYYVIMCRLRCLYNRQQVYRRF